MVLMYYYSRWPSRIPWQQTGRFLPSVATVEFRDAPETRWVAGLQNLHPEFESRRRLSPNLTAKSRIEPQITGQNPHRPLWLLSTYGVTKFGGNNQWQRLTWRGNAGIKVEHGRSSQVLLGSPR